MKAASAEPGNGDSPGSTLHFVRTARDLHESLCASDPATRLRTLKGVAAQPRVALDFGPHAGRDVIDLLLERSRTVGAGPEWKALLATLSAFRDPRVTSRLLEVLGSATDPQALFLAAHGLRDEPIRSLYGRAFALLLQNESEARARAVARLFRAAGSPGPEVAVRLSLLVEDDELPAPPVDARHTAAWLRELAGPYHAEARGEIEAQGEEAFARLAENWDGLDDDTRAWLVGWGGALSFRVVAPLVERALDADAIPVALAALEVLDPRDGSDAPVGWPGSLRPPLLRFASHADARLRLAAVVALRRFPAPVSGDDASGEFDWRTPLRDDPDLSVRRACAEELALAEGVDAVEDLLALLRDPDWRMRATAVDLLSGLDVLDRIEPLLEDPDRGARVAAAKLWIAAGRT